MRQLVAFGGIRGEVLDPGTGPGYHAIYFAQRGYSATGVDGSPTAIARARRDAERAAVRVDFHVADATELEGFEGRTHCARCCGDGLVHVRVWSVVATRLD